MVRACAATRRAVEQTIAPIVVPSVSTKTAHALMVKTIVLRLMPRLVLLLFMAFLPQELPLLTGLSTKTVLILQHLHQKVNRIYEIIPQTKRNSPPRELSRGLKPQSELFLLTGVSPCCHYHRRMWATVVVR